jgi:carbamoyl-phosphate synthase large subunit
MKDESIRSVLIIGSGPIVIGQACEFDYSGSPDLSAFLNVEKNNAEIQIVTGKKCIFTALKTLFSIKF